MARKKRRKSLSDRVLTLIDSILEGVAAGAMALLRLLGRLLMLAGRGLLALVRGAARALLWPFGRLLRLLGRRRNRASRCLRLTGEEFEAYAAQVLSDNGFRHVTVTRASGDQGIDILAVRNGRTYAIQCKNYAGAVGNAAVQEACAKYLFAGRLRPCNAQSAALPIQNHTRLWGRPARCTPFSASFGSFFSGTATARSQRRP